MISLNEVELDRLVPASGEDCAPGPQLPGTAPKPDSISRRFLRFFAKFRNSLVGPTSPVILPAASHFIDYEGELVVVIGKTL